MSPPCLLITLHSPHPCKHIRPTERSVVGVDWSCRVVPAFSSCIGCYGYLGILPAVQSNRSVWLRCGESSTWGILASWSTVASSWEQMLASCWYHVVSHAVLPDIQKFPYKYGFFEICEFLIQISKKYGFYTEFSLLQGDQKVIPTKILKFY